MEVTIAKEESRCFLQVGKESIEIKDYKISSSMQGGTELEIKLGFQNNMLRFLTSATLESLRQQNLNATSNGPTIQSIPLDSELGKKIKACLDDGDCLLEA